MNVKLTDAAETDLEEIGSWLSDNAGPAALGIVRGLRVSVASLGDMPARFPLVPGHEKTGVRRRVYGNYLIFYTIEDDDVRVLRILHGARDVDRIMFPTN